MKIAILGTKGIPNKYGGFEQFAEILSVRLTANGHLVTVYNPSFHYFKEPEFKNVRIKKIYSPEKIMGSSANLIYDFLCLRDAIKDKNDIILECGYGSPSFSYYLLNRKKSIIITNMDGIEWQRSKWGKFTKLVFKFSERLAVKKSDSIVSDNVCIMKYYKEKYNVDSEYIPYGAEISSHNDKTCLDKFNLRESGFYLMIARMEPENNIETVIDGYLDSGVSNEFMVISNKDSGYAKHLIRKYSKFKNIRFTGNNFNQEELHNLRFLSLAYFHGHSVGGTNPSLLEAMASGAFIIAHDNIYNRSVLNSSAVYFKNSGEVSLIIKNINELLIQKDIFTRDNLKRVETDYNWESITKKYTELFEKISLAVKIKYAGLNNMIKE